jgi:outer membrane beta-barrel protein
VALGQQKEGPGIDLTEPARPGVTRPGTSKTDGPQAPLAPGEADVAFADRVKAVQRKGFLKRHRFEVGLDLPATLNDPFYEKVGVGGKLAYNFDESFAVALRGTYFWSLRTNAVREGNLAFESQLLNSHVYGQVMLDGVWSPVYGKVAWLGSQIVHFDMYLLAGLGGVWSSTSLAPRSEGPHIATDLGLGIRFYPRSWLALDGGVIATLYSDQPSQAVPSSIQKIVAAHVGLTVFFPLHFEYVYP